jgi:hypothetical protein
LHTALMAVKVERQIGLSAFFQRGNNPVDRVHFKLLGSKQPQPIKQQNPYPAPPLG